MSSSTTSTVLVTSDTSSRIPAAIDLDFSALSISASKGDPSSPRVSRALQSGSPAAGSRYPLASSVDCNPVNLARHIAPIHLSIDTRSLSATSAPKHTPLSVDSLDDSGLGSSIHSVDGLSSTISRTYSHASSTARPKANRAPRSIGELTPIITAAPCMSQTTKAIVTARVFEPILNKGDLRSFHPFIRYSAPQQIENGNVVCLRDVERLLLLYARLRLGQIKEIPEIHRYESAVNSYRQFSVFAIERIEEVSSIVEKVQHTRPNDENEYSSVYFVSLIDQVRNHARRVMEARRSSVHVSRAVRSDSQNVQSSSDGSDSDATLCIEGGLADTGRPVRLMSARHRPLISDELHLANQQHNEVDCSDDGETAMRSMARRPKSDMDRPQPLISCRDCGHKERRQCDMNKHMKQHSRPYKCPISTCKFHQKGFMGEKERDRHVDEQHNRNPTMFCCDSCDYSSKRESNLKQHKENIHGWVYHRTRVVTTKANAAASRPSAASHGRSMSRSLSSGADFRVPRSQLGSFVEMSRSRGATQTPPHAWPTPDAESCSLSSQSYRGDMMTEEDFSLMPQLDFSAPLDPAPQHLQAILPGDPMVIPPWQFPTPESNVMDQFTPRTLPCSQSSGSSPYLVDQQYTSYQEPQLMVCGQLDTTNQAPAEATLPGFSPTAGPGARDLTFTRTLADAGFGDFSQPIDGNFWSMDASNLYEGPLFDPIYESLAASFGSEDELSYDLSGPLPMTEPTTTSGYRY